MRDEQDKKDEIFDSAEIKGVRLALKHRNAKLCELLRKNDVPRSVTSSLKYCRYVFNLVEHMRDDNNSPRDVAYLMTRDLAADSAAAFFAKKLLGVSLYPVLILDSAKYFGSYIEKAVEPIQNEVLSFSAPQNFAERQYQRDLRETWLATAPLVMTGKAWSAVRSFFSDQFDWLYSALTHPVFLKTAPHPMRFSSLFSSKAPVAIDTKTIFKRLDSSQIELPSALRDSINWDERRFNALPNVIIPWLTDRVPVPRDYYLPPKPVASDPLLNTSYTYFDPSFYLTAEKETAITDIDSEKPAHSEIITEIKPTKTTAFVGSTNTSPHTETKKSNGIGEITPVFRVVPGAFEIGTRIAFNDPIAPVVIVGVQVSDQLIADGLNGLIFNSKHSGTLYQFGRRYAYKCEGRFYKMEITVAEVNQKGDRCNRRYGKFKLNNLTYGDKENIPRIQKAINQYLSPLIAAHFREDRALFLQQINVALSQYDFSKAKQLHNDFYGRYAGIYSGFENEKQAGTQKLSESEKTYQDYQVALKLQAKLESQEELRLKELEDYQADLKLQKELELKGLEEQQHKKALLLSDLKEMHFRIQTTQLSVDAVFFLLKKAAPQLENYFEKANALLSAELQLAAHHYSFSTGALEQTATPLDYARYILLAAQLCRALASVSERHQFPCVKKTLLFADNYALPISQLILSTAFLLTGNVAVGAFLFSPELVLKIPEAREFLLSPDPYDQFAYARFIMGMILTQLLESKKTMQGVMTQATDYLGVYSNTIWEWIKRGLFSFSASSKEVAEQLVNFIHFETISNVLNNGFYLLKATEIPASFYKTNQQAEKNWNRYCLEWQRDQRKLAIVSLYFKHVISRSAEVGNTPVDDNSLFHAVSYYTEEDHQQLREMVVEVSIDALSKKLNRPIMVISQGNLNLEPISNEMYDLAGDPIFIFLNENNHYSAFLPRGESYFERDYAKKLAAQKARLPNIDFHTVTAAHENIMRSLDSIHEKTAECKNKVVEIDRINNASQQLTNAIAAKLTLFEKPKPIAHTDENIVRFTVGLHG